MVKNSSKQRSLGNDFWYKTLPVLTIGMIIWVLFTLLFSGFLGIKAIALNLIIVIVLIILYFLFWVITIIFSIKKNNILGMLFFLGASLITGMLSSSFLIWARTIVVFELVLGIFFIAFFSGLLITVGLLIIGLFLREKIGQKWIYPLIYFGFSLFVLEISLIVIFGYNPILIITSIFVLIWLFGVILWDGSRLSDTVQEGYWMMAVLDIFLDMINVIIRIFVIIVEIIAERS